MLYELPTPKNSTYCGLTMPQSCHVNVWGPFDVLSETVSSFSLALLVQKLSLFKVPSLALGAYARLEHLKVLHSGFLRPYPNNRLCWKGLPGTNTLTYYVNP